MRPNRRGKRVPPQPGGESFQVFEAGPPTYQAPLPGKPTRVTPVPLDEWQVFEAGPPIVPPAPEPNDRPPEQAG